MRQAHPSKRLRKFHRPLNALSIHQKRDEILRNETRVHRQSIKLLSTLFSLLGTNMNLKSENTNLVFLHIMPPFLLFPLKQNKRQSLREDMQEPSLTTNSGTEKLSGCK